jgi:hypothetical protein
MDALPLAAHGNLGQAEPEVVRMSLEEKAKRLAEARKPEAFDWNAARELWLSNLRDLHDKITAWLEPLRAQNLVTLRKTPVRISEEHLGAYAADALVLEFGDEGVVLEPAGAVVVGAMGRVDVYRRGNRPRAVMLLLGGPKETPVWHIWPTQDPRDQGPLTQQSFEALLESLLGI